MGKLHLSFPCPVNRVIHDSIACYAHFHNACLWFFCSACGAGTEGHGGQPGCAGAPRYPRENYRLPGQHRRGGGNTSGDHPEGYVRACKGPQRGSHLRGAHLRRVCEDRGGEARLCESHVVRRQGLRGQDQGAD